MVTRNSISNFDSTPQLRKVEFTTRFDIVPGTLYNVKCELERSKEITWGFEMSLF